MNIDQSKVLMVGATGKFGYLTARELSRKAHVRALIRSAAKEPEALATGIQETVVADLGDPATLVAAAEGMDGVFLIGPAFHPQESEYGVALVDAAKRAGVKKFVYSSVIQPTNIALSNHASKIPVEAAIYSSCLEYTILQPANFMQNIGFAWRRVVATGIFREPFPTSARVARVDYRDVAEVASLALTTDRLAFSTLELAAGMYDRNQIAWLMSEALGRPVRAMEVSFEDWVADGKTIYTDRQLTLLSKVFSHYAAYGLGGNQLTLEAALGRPARSLRQYISELPTQPADAPAPSEA